MCRGLNTNTIIKNKNVKISVLQDFFPPMIDSPIHDY